MKFISGQNPVVVHIEHLKADWKKTTRERTSLTQPVTQNNNSGVQYDRNSDKLKKWKTSEVIQGWFKSSRVFSGLTFLPLSDGPPAAGRKSTRDLFKVDVIVPVLIKGVEQAWWREKQPLNKLYPFHMLHFSHTHTRLPSLSEAWMGGETRGINVSKSKRPVLDWAFSSQYRFSKSIMSDSSTVQKKKHREISITAPPTRFNWECVLFMMRRCNKPVLPLGRKKEQKLIWWVSGCKHRTGCHMF